MNAQDPLKIDAAEIADRRAERKYQLWMVAHVLGGISAFIAVAPIVMALRLTGIAEQTAMVLGFLAVALLLSMATIATWLQTHHWLGGLFRNVRSRALIGAERLARDDEDLMLDGIREVVFEWHHIDDLLKERDLSALALGATTALVFGSLVYLSLLITQAMVSLGVLDSVSPAWSIGAFAILAALNGISGFGLSWSVYNSKCFSESDYDPTKVIQERVSTLLTEVKALRRTGVIA